MYQVKHWGELFENSGSRRFKNLTRCTMPTKHGLGFRQIIQSKNGAALFGAWCALIQVLSRQHPPREGFVTHDGTKDGNPLTPHDLELLTGIKSTYYQNLFEIASTQVVDWLRITKDAHTTHTPRTHQTHTSTHTHTHTHTHTLRDSSVTPSKSSHGEFGKVKLTKDEYDKLIDKHGEADTTAAIQVLDDYIESSGKRYKSHYAVLKPTGWVWQRLNQSTGSKPRITGAEI